MTKKPIKEILSEHIRYRSKIKKGTSLYEFILIKKYIPIRENKSLQIHLIKKQYSQHKKRNNTDCTLKEFMKTMNLVASNIDDPIGGRCMHTEISDFYIEHHGASHPLSGVVITDEHLNYIPDTSDGRGRASGYKKKIKGED